MRDMSPQTQEANACQARGARQNPHPQGSTDEEEQPDSSEVMPATGDAQQQSSQQEAKAIVSSDLDRKTTENLVDGLSIIVF